MASRKQPRRGDRDEREGLTGSEEAVPLGETSRRLGLDGGFPLGEDMAAV